MFEMQFAHVCVQSNKLQKRKKKLVIFVPVDLKYRRYGWMTNGAKSRTARFDRLPWFSYHSADAVPIEGTVL